MTRMRMGGRQKWAAALAALLLMVCAGPGVALDFPPLTGRVVDNANILDIQQRAEITQQLEALEAKSTDQLVVVTLPGLQGTSIEDFGYQLGRTWQVGQQGKNNGVLLIVAPNERKVRIEVGYGLEGTLTDALGAFIIQNSILPRLRAGDFPGGIRKGVTDIIDVLTNDASEVKQRAVKSAAEAARGPESQAGADLFFGIFIFIIFCVALNIYLTSRSMNATGKRGRSSGWIIGPSSGGGWSSGSSGSSGGGFSGGGGSFGGGGSSGSW